MNTFILTPVLSDFKSSQSDMFRVTPPIEAEPAMRRRLLDIGLIPGTRVTCTAVSPAGDPAAYLIRGAVIALRGRDAGGVYLGDALWD